MSTTTRGEITMSTLTPAPSSLMEKPAFSVPAKKMAMWLFIIADTATFAGCLVAYGFLRNATPNWPRPFHSITNLAIMTFILLTSSLTMLNGVRAAKAGNKARCSALDPDHRRFGYTRSPCSTFVSGWP